MSFNSLLEIASHGTNSDLDSWMPLQDDAATTSITDESNNGSGGILVGGDNSEDLSGVGPNTWLTKAIDFSLGSSYIELNVSPAYSSDEATFLAWMIEGTPRVNSGPSIINGFVAGGSQRSFHPFSNGWIYEGVFRTNSSGTTSRVTVGDIGTLTNWREICVKTEVGASGWVYRADGTTEASDTGLTLLKSSQIFRLGYNGSEYFNGKIAGLALFSNKLTDLEEADAFDGPEPVNITPPTISESGGVLTVTPGTWGLPTPFDSGTNGTITHSYSWYRYSDTQGNGETYIGSGTTYTLTASDKFVRVKERGINDGGYDEAADTPSNYYGSKLLQEAEITASATPIAYTLNGVAAGSKLVVVLARFSSGNRIYSVSDNQGNTWTDLQQDVSSRAAFLSYAESSTGGSVEITISSNYPITPDAVHVFELDSSVEFNTSGTFTRPSNDTTHYASDTPGITSSEQSVAIVSGVHNSIAVPSPSSGYTQYSNDTSLFFAIKEAESLTNERGEWTSGNSRNCAGVLAVFSEPEFGPPTFDQDLNLVATSETEVLGNISVVQSLFVSFTAVDETESVNSLAFLQSQELSFSTVSEAETTQSITVNQSAVINFGAVEETETLRSFQYSPTIPLGSVSETESLSSLNILTGSNQLLGAVEESEIVQSLDVLQDLVYSLDSTTELEAVDGLVVVQEQTLTLPTVAENEITSSILIFSGSPSFPLFLWM